MLVVFYIISQVVRTTIELVFEKMIFVRRLLLGDQFVEGLWFDKIYEDSTLMSIGHSMIKYSDGKFRFGGEDYSVDGNGKGNFRVKLVEFSWPTLEYTYVYETNDRDQQGYGTAQFMESIGGPPKQYDGKFVNRSDGKRYTFESFKVTNDDILKSFNLETNKKKVILNYFQLTITSSPDFTPQVDN